MSKIPIVRQRLSEHGADAALLTFLPDIRWACGFTGSNGVLLVDGDAAHFVTDGRYTIQAEREVQAAHVHIATGNLLAYVAEQGLLREDARVVVQAEHVSLAQSEELRSRMEGVTWLPVPEFLVRRVAQKDDEEVARIRAAQRVTEEVFGVVLGLLRPGLTEQEVAAEIVYQHLRRGAQNMSFEPIVASGPQGALPHARPTPKEIQAGELVVLDFGCFLNGYASDMTRTVAVGEPGDEARRAYQTVLRAQEAAIAQAHAGIASNSLDSVARGVISEAGLGPYFTHGLGHGVGLQIHEWPRVSFNVEYELPEGAVVTIEPGVYVPDRFGIRIEDMIVLRNGGCENLTAAPKDLLVL